MYQTLHSADWFIPWFKILFYFFNKLLKLLQFLPIDQSILVFCAIELDSICSSYFLHFLTASNWYQSQTTLCHAIYESLANIHDSFVEKNIVLEKILYESVNLLIYWHNRSTWYWPSNKIWLVFLTTEFTKYMMGIAEVGCVW